MKNTKNKSLAEKVIQLIFMAFLAKGLGFVREMVLAYYYGASAVSDVYVVVQNIPAIIFTVFGTAVTTGFIPLYTEISIKKGKTIADKFANNILNIFLILSIVLSVLGIVFADALVNIFAGGFLGDTYKICVLFAKIVMPTNVAIILVYVYNAYLQIHGFFNQNSLMNIPYNLVQIAFIVIGFYLNNPIVLAIGLLNASFSQLVYLQILIRKKTDFKHARYTKLSDPLILKMLILVGPIFISTGVNQLNVIVDRALGTGLVAGSVSALNYSNEVASVTQVIILSLSTVLYPKLVELFAGIDSGKRNEFVEVYLNTVSVVIFPLAAFVYLFAEEIIEILFGRGAFTAETVAFVSRALRLYAIGIIGASFRDSLNKVFYAMKDTVTPMINGTVAVGVNIALNFLLIGKYEYLGLAFATSVSATICTVLLFVQMLLKLNGFKKMDCLVNIFKSFGAMIGMSIAILGAEKYLLINSAILRCCSYGMFGLIVYFILLYLSREKSFVRAVSHIQKQLI